MDIVSNFRGNKKWDKNRKKGKIKEPEKNSIMKSMKQEAYNGY